MVRYADKTVVPIEQSIRAMLHQVDRFGGTNFQHKANIDEHAYIGFELLGEQIRIYVPLPARVSPRYTTTPSGRHRDRWAADNLYEQDRRQIYRDLYLATTYRLEAVGALIKSDLGGVRARDAVRATFLGDLVVDERHTVGDLVAPRLDEARAEAQAPALLLRAAPTEQEP